MLIMLVWIKALAEGINDKFKGWGRAIYAMLLEDLSRIPYMILNTLVVVVVICLKGPEPREKVIYRATLTPSLIYVANPIKIISDITAAASQIATFSLNPACSKGPQR